jgi:hypothetical protein
MEIEELPASVKYTVICDLKPYPFADEQRTQQGLPARITFEYIPGRNEVYALIQKTPLSPIEYNVLDKRVTSEGLTDLMTCSGSSQTELLRLIFPSDFFTNSNANATLYIRGQEIESASCIRRQPTFALDGKPFTPK